MKRLKLYGTVAAVSMCICFSTGCGDRNQEKKETVSVTEGIPAEGKDEYAFVHDSNLNKPGELGEGKPTICKEKVKLTIGVAQNSNVEDWETNKMTLRLEEVGNYDLSFKEYPAEEFVTQINLATTAGGKNLPDILLTGPSDSVVASWGQAGSVIPLNAYYENSTFYLKEAIGRTGVDFYPLITAADGNMYYVPQYNQSLTNEYGAKIWIYEPWLDALNLDKPTTPEELREVLKAFTTGDPNGNGMQDEIGLIARTNSELQWFEALMAPFQYLPFSTNTAEGWWNVENGTVSAAYAAEGYREGLKYIRSLFEEGLIDPLSFTNDITQTQALLTQEDTVVGTYVYASMSDIPAADKRRTEYVGIAPLISADGTQYTPYAASAPYVGGVITSNCKNPEAAFRLLDYMVSEEMSIWTRWGEKGIDWVEPEEGEESMFAGMGYPAVLKDILPWGVPQNAHWYQTGPYIRQYSIALGLAWDGNQTNTSYLISTIQDEYTDKHPDEMITKLIYTIQEQEIVTPILTSLNSYVKEMIANFCTNNNGMDVDNDEVWEQYLAQLENIGLSKALEIVQTSYDRMNK